MDADVIVVGAGVMGSATAWALAKRGVETLVVEQFEPGHGNGSSHGATRIFRFAYDDPFHVALAQRALPLWRELESLSGRALLTVTGGLDFGTPDYLFDSAAALHSCGAVGDILSAAERRERFRGIGYGTEPALYSPDTGVLAASACVEALLDAAQVPLRANTRILSIAPDEGGVTLTTAEGTLRARHVVMTAGGWAGPLAATFGVELPLQVSREQVFYFDGGEGLPVVIERGDLFRYVLPPAHGARAKAGEHGTGERTTADGRSFDIDPVGQARVVDWIARELPAIDARPRSAETCLYTLTPDEEFVVERHGAVTVASPCSGHGFKFAPILGEAFAALAVNEDPPIDVSRYETARFF